VPSTSNFFVPRNPVMFGKIISALTLCAMLGLTSAAPVQLANALYGRDLQPLSPTAQIQPGIFDLLDQFKNLAQQAAAAPKGTPQFIALVSQMDSTKAKLEAAIQGVAVLATDPTTASTNATSSTIVPTTTTTPSAATTTTTNASTTASPGSKSTPTGTSPSLTSIAPPETGSADVPPMTIVTQVGTSIVVVASQGVTSTITLPTRTAVSGAATSTASSSFGATSIFDINTAAAPGTT